MCGHHSTDHEEEKVGCGAGTSDSQSAARLDMEESAGTQCQACQKTADLHVKCERMGFHCTARVCKGSELAEAV